MAHPEQQDTGTAAVAEAPAADAPATDVQAQIDQAVEAALAAHGIQVTPPEKEPILDALKTLGQDAEHLSFVQKLEHLAADGYQAVTDGPYAPEARALFAVVEALVEKVA